MQQVSAVLKEFKTREVLVDTSDGRGKNFAHPANPSFDNPITAIHHVDSGTACLKFETRDFALGQHAASQHAFVKLAIDPSDAQITTIRVFFYADHILGIELIGKNGVLLV